MAYLTAGAAQAKADRFWPKVNRSSEGCWEWLASKDTVGYGIMKIAGRLQGAHRIAWTLTNGEIPTGQHVLHICDVRHCCNPAHLFLGTHQDNMADRQRKGRTKTNPRSGVEHALSKLNDDSVRMIRSLRACGWMNKDIAHLVGVTAGTVSSVALRTSWRHVS